MRIIVLRIQRLGLTSATFVTIGREIDIGFVVFSLKVSLALYHMPMHVSLIGGTTFLI